VTDPADPAWPDPPAAPASHPPGPWTAAAEAWLADDPDPATREELAGLLAAGDDDALADRFGARLQFGTAGLRGPMGAGPNRMNRALVRRAAAGLADWLVHFHPEGIGDGVVICFDARHHSREFAEDTAAVLAAQAITAHVLAGPLPTPLLAFAVKHLRAAAGVMVTASHNPGGDNGYKVYDASGAQIVAPVDEQISAAIDAVGPMASITRAAPDHALIDRVGPELVRAYLAAVVGMLPPPDPPVAPLSVVYSALHGVGGELVVALLEQAGLPAPTLVDEQFAPDADFPTLAFPNPEEPGAMSLTLAKAAASGADIAVVNDPDADRLAVAVPDPSLGPPATAAGWRMLRGDEVGVLLADAARG
jgi:phosphomannomutase